MTSRPTFYGIQLLRGLAAVLVVCFHVASNLAANDPTSEVIGLSAVFFAGNAGVDLFFLISGFVIVWTTQDDRGQDHAWSDFLTKRVWRIFPLYWILTTAKLVTILVMPSLFRNSHLVGWNVIASYLLIPSTNGIGKFFPVMDAGWTLCFEMAFYYVYAACMATRFRPIHVVTPLFATLGLMGIFRVPDWGAVASLIDPLLLEFVAGMWIADLTRQGKVQGRLWPMVGLFISGVALWLASDLLANSTAHAYRTLVWGGPATLILYATIALETHVNFRKLRLPLLLGNASYSIYLVHPLALSPAMKVARMTSLPGGQYVSFLALVTFGVVSGVVVWWGVERQVLSRLTQHWKPWAGGVDRHPESTIERSRP